MLCTDGQRAHRLLKASLWLTGTEGVGMGDPRPSAPSHGNLLGALVQFPHSNHVVSDSIMVAVSVVWADGFDVAQAPEISLRGISAGVILCN